VHLPAFFDYPNGAIWGNVYAMPVCAVIAGVFAFLFRDHIGRACSDWWKRHFGHHAELDDIKARLETHADALSLETPGGLAAVMAEVRAAKTAAEAAHGAVQALGVLKPAARRGATEMRKTGGGKGEGA
jgi:hypothetical protein